MEQFIHHCLAYLRVWDFDGLLAELEKMKTKYPIHYTDGSVSSFHFLPYPKHRVPNAVLINKVWLSLDEVMCSDPDTTLSELKDTSLKQTKYYLPTVAELDLNKQDLKDINELLVKLGKQPLEGTYWCLSYMNKRKHTCMSFSASGSCRMYPECSNEHKLRWCLEFN